MFRTLHVIICAVAVLSWICPQSALAQAEQAMLGDVNQDGFCNVMDIQAAVCQALQTQTRTREADINEDGSVDILDVQNAISTALGAGGLMQRVQGTLDCSGIQVQDRDRIRLKAVSQDGQTAECDVDPATGQFQLNLRVKTAWAFAFMASNQEGTHYSAGPMQFAYAGENTPALPVPHLSQGQAMNMGQLQFSAQIRTQHEIRTMLGAVNSAAYRGDTDGNGIPDMVEPLMNRVMNGPGMPQNMSRNGLDLRVAQCVSSFLENLAAPSLTDENADGVPDFVEPLMDCLESNIVGWLQENGHTVPPGDANHNGVPDMVDQIVDYIRAGIDEWLANLNDPDVIDGDSDGIPDYLEPYLDVEGGSNGLDGNADGIPDFSQDADSDGIPNCQDPDYAGTGDSDGDSVPNAEDIDDDNDGIPDYADAE